MTNNYQQQTINAYNRNAKLWNMTRNRFWNEYTIYIHNILDELLLEKNEINILDAGCGNGRMLFVIDQYIKKKEWEYREKDKSPHKKNNNKEEQTIENKNNFKINYTGFDPSRELIIYAKELFPHHGDNLSVSDILDFEDYNKYDAIFSFAVFHHFNKEDFESNFNKLNNLLNDGGIICITIWNIWYKYFWEVIRFYFDNLFSYYKNAYNKNISIKYNFGDYIMPLFQKDTMRFVHAYNIFDIRNIIKKQNKKNRKESLPQYNISELKNTYTKDKKECNILLIVKKII